MSRSARWTYLIQHYVDAAAGARPDSFALRSPEGAVTYGELSLRSNRLAHALRSGGVRRGDRVALCLTRGPSSVIAMLGSLKADAIYVPLHERWPRERWSAILADCQPTALVTDRQNAARVLEAWPGAHQPRPTVVLGGTGAPPADPRPEWITEAGLAAQPDGGPECRNVDRDVAHILYTSGSTGRPKGVMISHLNIANYVDWAVPYLSMTPADRVLGTAPFHFDMSTFDLYATQRAGAALCVATEEQTLFPAKLVGFMESEAVTLWKGVASLLAYLARTGAVQPGRLPTLTRVLFSGERLPTPALLTWMRAFPEKRFFNVYGPTEATGISTAYELPGPPSSADVAVPVGRACANSEVLVLAEYDQPAAVGDVGEICIRGSSVSPGYWRDPERTRHAFVENPAGPYAGDRLYRTGDLGFWDAGGDLHLVGRRDDQVKWMGYRIELGEITVALEALPGVEDAAVLLLPDEAGTVEQLVAFVVLASGTGSAEVVTGLRRRLPPYMVPRRVVALERLPRTDRGKVDREALRRYRPAPESAG
jgi:amino acid adenylation domain-containing protein